jgi:hypothetical protein
MSHSKPFSPTLNAKKKKKKKTANKYKQKDRDEYTTTFNDKGRTNNTKEETCFFVFFLRGGSGWGLTGYM